MKQRSMLATFATGFAGRVLALLRGRRQLEQIRAEYLAYRPRPPSPPATAEEAAELAKARAALGPPSAEICDLVEACEPRKAKSASYVTPSPESYSADRWIAGFAELFWLLVPFALIVWYGAKYHWFAHVF